MASGVEQTYRYLRPSSVSFAGAGAAEVLLSTSGGVTEAGPEANPRFFDGFLGNAEQAATALLVVAKVARTRFYTPPGMLAAILRAADPVVTSNRDRMRFESFSACCGVYARLDVLPECLDGPAISTGTTNVDFNPPMREALARVGGLDPLHLRVGEGVVVTTMDAQVTEKKVPLPERWLKGFGEVQLAAAGMTPTLEVDATEARRFIRSLPTPSGARAPRMWAVQAGRGLRLTGRPAPGAVPVPGPERLKVLDPLLRFASGLRAYAQSEADAPTASSWELDLDGARLVVTLSPEVSRGFSGEGGVLWDLADETAAEDAQLVSALLSYEPTIDLVRLACDAALPQDRVVRALAHLGAAGRVGYDLAAGSYFHRELPFDPDALATMHPRLRDARAIIDSGAVRIVDEVGYVRSGDAEHVVRKTPDGDRCTCPWYGKHGASRGPCKHVLAVDLVRRGG